MATSKQRTAKITRYNPAQYRRKTRPRFQFTRAALHLLPSDTQPSVTTYRAKNFEARAGPPVGEDLAPRRPNLQPCLFLTLSAPERPYSFTPPLARGTPNQPATYKRSRSARKLQARQKIERTFSIAVRHDAAPTPQQQPHRCPPFVSPHGTQGRLHYTAPPLLPRYPFCPNPPPIPHHCCCRWRDSPPQY